MKRPNCYTCIHRRSLPGNAHSSCALLESLGIDNGTGLLFAIQGLTPDTIEFNPHGIANGWALWPIDFDPVWLTRCDHHRENEKTKKAAVPAPE